MYKVLLVDDERIILDGISAIVDWESAGTVLHGTARNGIEAYELVMQDPPDIIISDIKMPGMDGLELAAKVSQSHPNLKLVLLSGFSEFEYAQRAMHYGVRHYLLKPSNENKIAEVLQELVAELDAEQERQKFVQGMRYGLEKVLPHVKEQFLKEFVTNKTYGNHDWEYYSSLFKLDLENRKVRLLLFRLEPPFEFEHMFAVKNIAEELLGATVLSATVGENVLIVAEDAEESTLVERIDQIRTTFMRYYRIDLTIAMSEADEFLRARHLYKQTLECLNHRFYLEEGGLITVQDLAVTESHEEAEEFQFDHENMLLQIKAGDHEEACLDIDRFFERMADLRLDLPTAKSYVIELFMAIIRLEDKDEVGRSMDKLVALTAMDTRQALQSFCKETAIRIALSCYEETKSKHSAIVQKMKDIVREHLSNPELSLNWVAHQMLYMNSDYLGKLFKKETEEKFSGYVMKERISKATELIEQRGDIKIFELAEQLGFGDNPQYFSQVFKKYTGLTPSEFMKSNS
ncbi:response regulator [Paenibacillus cremeus]|uniref:Response regulator transcription factor n=1 Tax=Paenibacillus cremeus TaxID=2163881 RepID=A0A559K962_9BACL|nr:response regulator [Paenibacillus cremeus]TVY08623.1 response regulator transcription factor [Paenibacillus cremeus]